MNQVPKPFGESQKSVLTKSNLKLKSEANTANGGIGVSYSNVVLGGGNFLS